MLRTALYAVQELSRNLSGRLLITAADWKIGCWR